MMVVESSMVCKGILLVEIRPLLGGQLMCKIDLFEELETDLNQPSAGVYFVGSRRVQGTNHSAGF
jgi:hypothetical protein